MNASILKIKEDLENDKITYSVAYNLIKALPKPWKTNDWRIQRDRILKNYCEQCGNTQDILVAQHLSHPRRFSDIRFELLRDLIENSEWAKEESVKPIKVTKNEIESFKLENSIKRLACPNCFHLSFQERKTCQIKYKCYHCKTEFETPTEINYSKLFKKKIESVDIKSFLMFSKEEIRRNYISQTIYEQNAEQLGKKALLLSIEDHVKYLSMDGVVTFCKKCASKMDKYNLLLCYDCKQNYFDMDLYDNCYCCYQKGLMTINPFKSIILNFKLNNEY